MTSAAETKIFLVGTSLARLCTASYVLVLSDLIAAVYAAQLMYIRGSRQAHGQPGHDHKLPRLS